MANGTIAFDTLQTSDSVNTGTSKTLDTSYLYNGSAKAWHISTDAAVAEDSFNVSTATDNGTGDYTFPFTNNMNNATYAHPHSACIVNCAAWSHTRATSSMRIAVFYDEGAVRDSRTHGTVNGDLA